jgi:thioredoxin 1
VLSEPPTLAKGSSAHWYTGTVDRLIYMPLDDLTDGTLAGYLDSSQLPAVLVFHAAWSRPARTMLPVVDDLSGDYEHMLRFAKVNSDFNPQAVNRYGVLSLPTYLVVKRGRVVDRFIGLLTKEKLLERIEASLAKL